MLQFTSIIFSRRLVSPLPHPDPTLMASIEHVHPLLLKRRQYAPRLALLGLARQPSERLKVLREVRVDGGERRTVALHRDPIFFPSALFLQRRQLGFASQHSRGGDGLPFEDLECQSSANLATISFADPGVKWGLRYILLPQIPRRHRSGEKHAGISQGHGYFGLGYPEDMAGSR